MTNNRVTTKPKSDAEITEFTRETLKHPYVIFAFFLTGIYGTFIGRLYTAYPTETRLIISQIWAIIAYALCYLLGGKLLTFLNKHRIPYFVGIVGFFAIPCLIEGLIATIFFEKNISPVIVINHIIFIWTCVIPGTAIFLGIEQDRFAKNIFIVPPNKFIWFDWEEPKAKKTKPKAEKILRLEAQNQYTLIHMVNGRSKLVRMSLAKAIETYCEDTEGMRVHRSHFVTYQDIKDIMYVNGNPRLLLNSGTELPVSRSAYQSLKDVKEAEMLNTAMN